MLRCLSIVVLCSFALPAEAGRVVSASSGQRYELGRRVGKGGFGKVYKAWPVTGAREPVAIKLYDSLATALVEHEVHEAIGGVAKLPQAVGDGFDTVAKKNFLVSSWVPGRTLEAWSKSRPRSPSEVVGAVRSAAQVVGDLHARGWVHLDITPRNIMIDRHAGVAVIDVGIAQRKGTVASGDGTRGFMAPEQRGKAAVDERADVFGLTATLYRLLTGKEAVVHDVVATDLTPIRDESLRAIVARGLAADPSARFASARQLAQALSAWSARSGAP